MDRLRQNKVFLFILAFIILLLICLSIYFFFYTPSAEDEYVTDPMEATLDPVHKNYDASLLDDSEENRMIKYGYELFVHTPQYIGPENGNPGMVYSGNNLACNNCHLQAGTKPYSGMLIGVINRFPQYRGREDKMGSIEERINGCMERSMNGRMLPLESKEMLAFVSYLKWLSRDAPEDGKVEGMGYVEIELPNRPVDLQKGQALFVKTCVVCHDADGQGVKLKDRPGYLYPPLWGDDSYNHGAGMARVITAAQFIKTNMPFGTTYENPQLSDEECYDLAGYINQHSRPLKSHPEKDFPDLKKKPVSTPYPPYADTFSVKQHQVGPFQPIMEYYQKKYGLKKNK